MTSVRPAPAAAGAALSRPGARAVLIGTGEHVTGSGLPDVPAVSTTLADLEQVLVQHCGMAESNVRVLADPLLPLEVGRVLTDSAQQAQDVLLVYYVGHGLVSPGGELYLAIKSTERQPELLAYNALAYTAVRTSLLQSPARSIVVILDCCFSGRALGVLGAPDDAAAVDLAQVHGGYVLTSAAREELALAPPGARHTAFTGELIRLLTRGDPDGPALLTLRHAYKYLHRALPARGFPKPHCHASEWIEDLVLAPNPAYRPSKDVPAGPDAPELADDVCPYPGLAAFQAADTRWFFGRERVTTELVGRLAARLDQTRPLVLVGASGSGKSSLLRAGLLPALSAGTLLGPGSRTWPHLLLTPTADPVSELATHIARLAGVEPSTVRAELVANPDGFADTVRLALAAWTGEGEISGARVVLVVDQFEEIFLRCTKEQDRQVFIRALCVAVGAGNGAVGGEPPALVVLGMRADLYGRCAAYPELLPALQDGQFVLGPMRPTELRAVIEGPARAAGLTLEPGLVETLLHELSAGNSSGRAGGNAPHDPGALPLLSHALQATWEHREDRTLTLAGYQATGGIHGAVANTAEATFRGLDPTEQEAARGLLLRMIQISDDVPDTRLRADRNTLIATAPDRTAASVVFDAFARARLITLDEDAAEITHEALLHAWPRLRGWIDTARAAPYVHQQLTEAAQKWEHDGRPTSVLYRDTNLAVVQEWANKPDHQGNLGKLERHFLATSKALRDRRQRQLIASVVILLVLSLAGGIALYQKGSTPHPSTVLAGHTGGVTSVVFSPDGRTLATTSTDKTARLWDVRNPRQPGQLGILTGHTGDVTSLAFSPDARTLATTSTDQTARLWDVRNPHEPHPLSVLTSHTDSISSVDFSRDGHTLATASNDRTVRLWDISNPSQPRQVTTLTGYTNTVNKVAFSPNEYTLATASTSKDNTVQLWNVSNPSQPRQLATFTGHTNTVNEVAFSPSGRTLATASNDRSTRLWDISNPSLPRQLGTLPGYTNTVNDVAFGPDERTLATASFDKATPLWDVSDPRQPQPLTTLTGHADAVISVAFSPDGRTLATASGNQMVRLWNLP